ncbi:hypothetical protein FSP39_017688 [Pinctada imbricata]|uniref:Uncharacterized protein n=1 Tax=Pinctada imbricata TaxID=66713 RepID=A0AA88YAX9_PINIB|nr:hypothetical protein FSP39_017688 [Pinctada imbricata]
MPKKKGKKKGGKKAKAKVEGAEDIVQSLLKCYERNCTLTDSQMCPGIKNALRECKENETVLNRFILEPEPVEKPGDMPVLLEPLLAAFRQERYIYITFLHLWGYPMSYENAATLGLLLEKGCYPFKCIELEDCLLEPYSVYRLARSFNHCSILTTINLDYNEFGDEGCKNLCKGLEGNTTMLSVSMCYCDLTVESGKYLGGLISSTAVRDLFVDGNNLECDGLLEIIKTCVEQAKYEAARRAEEALRKEQEELEKAAKEKEGKYKSGGETSGDEGKDKEKKKKKKKGKKKEKEPAAPPPVGPWIHKLHIADNGIDGLVYGKEFAPLMMTRTLQELIRFSDCFEELDLEDNLIGDLAAREILEALEYRKEHEKLGGVKLRTTHRLNADTFNSIVKLGSGLKKKKKKGKKVRIMHDML